MFLFQHVSDKPSLASPTHNLLPEHETNQVYLPHAVGQSLLWLNICPSCSVFPTWVQRPVKLSFETSESDPQPPQPEVNRDTKVYHRGKTYAITCDKRGRIFLSQVLGPTPARLGFTYQQLPAGSLWGKCKVNYAHVSWFVSPSSSFRTIYNICIKSVLLATVSFE